MIIAPDHPHPGSISETSPPQSHPAAMCLTAA
jgi:hypothetical protein